MEGVINMAMKLTPAQKATDSFIRQYNKQIERAYRELGANNTVTRNLVHNAKRLFGTSNMKEQTIKSGHIDKRTGEVTIIPQISRSRKALEHAGSLENRTSVVSNLRNSTMYKTPTGNEYRSTFNVTRKRNEIINKANTTLKNQFLNLNPNMNMALKENQKKFKEFQRSGLTREIIGLETMLNDMQSEIFEAYELAKENGEDISDYQEFAYNYHSNEGNQTAETITALYEARNDTLNNALNRGQSLTDVTDTSNPALQAFNEYLRNL